MSEFLQVVTTTDSRESATRIADDLVDQRAVELVPQRREDLNAGVRRLAGRGVKATLAEHLAGAASEIGMGGNPERSSVAGRAMVRIPMHRGHLLRFDRGQATDLMAATIPI